ncbi:hypothetical protein GWN42_14025, partial [candidate division KSB1 bacterium]|nr:hypothetical protein [candidate division KSB1 bacterium]
GEKLTLKSKIVLAKNKRAVSHIVSKLFETVGFEGRNYLLRHYAFKRLKQAVEDYDLREWLMGHKGKISAVYDHEHYLTVEEINQYKSMIDTQVLHVYGLNRSQEEIIETRIETLKALLKDLNLNDVHGLKKELTNGKITIDQFNKRLTQLAQDSMNRHIESRFEQLFKKYNKKYNNH